MVRFLGLWTGAMVWHLYRLITLRPVFAQMADSVVTATSFSLVFFVAGGIRFFVANGADWHRMAITLALYYLWIAVCLERRVRSSSLLCAALGFSAAFDVLVVLLHAVGVLPSVNPMLAPGVPLLALEVLGIAILRQQFLRCPPDVQARGYRRL